MKRQIMVVRKLDRIPLRQKSVIVSAFAMMAAALVAEAKPVTWWASHPAKPGEHVLVSGGGWTGNVKVRFEGRLMDPTSGRHGLRVALPVKAATSALRKNPLVIVPLGDAVNRIK